jgi:hypothetical protein
MKVDPTINQDVSGSGVSPKTLNVLECMLWGAVCMPDAREKILSMNHDLFSKELGLRMKALQESLDERKVDQRVDEWFMSHRVNIKEANNVLQAIETTLNREHERKTIADFSNLMRSCAQVGDRRTLVKLMKECLASLGEPCHK